MKAIINGRLLLPNMEGDFRVMDEMAVLYDEHIERIIDMDEVEAEAGIDEVHDAHGLFVAPGFINVHVHGACGWDVMDETPEALPAISRFLARTGVASWLPTTMTASEGQVHDAFERVRSAMQNAPEGARVLGAHMEGPFISAAHRGAQAKEQIVRADYGWIASYEDVVRIVTLAPEELEGNYTFIDRCRAAGIIVSIGHSGADYGTALEVIERHGVTHITHIFNAMSGLHQRHPGVVGAALDTAANCELIADDVHVDPAAQRILYHAKEGRHIILVTDSMRAAGFGDGTSELGGQQVTVRGARAELVDGTLAGSVLAMNDAVRNFARNTRAPIERVVEMVTRTPAEELGIYEETGSLEEEKRADLTLFDEDLHIAATIVGGRLAYIAHPDALEGGWKKQGQENT